MTGNYRVEKLIDNVVIFILSGTIDSDTAIKFVYQAKHIIQDLKKVRILNDINQLESFSEGAKGILSLFYLQNDFYVEKEAAYGLNDNAIKQLLEIVKMATRKDVKVFSSKLEAEKWLEVD